MTTYAKMLKNGLNYNNHPAWYAGMHYDETDTTEDIQRGNGRIKHGMSYDEARNEMISLCSIMEHMNFALCMLKEDGSYSTYSREHQPCQGGEMRKYKETHGDECTQPEDRRPGDLYDPFPTGKPVMVSRHFSMGMEEGVFDAFHDLEVSPYRRAIPAFEKIHTDGKLGGVLYEGMSVDPTAFVNLQQAVNSKRNLKVSNLLNAGLNLQEAVISMMLNGGNLETPASTYSYYFPVSASIRRLIDGDFYDLSGGTFEDRFDYNRRYVQDLFKARDGETVTNFFERLQKSGVIVQEIVQPGPYQYYIQKLKSLEAYAEVVRDIIKTDYQTEIDRLLGKEKAA